MLSSLSHRYFVPHLSGLQVCHAFSNLRTLPRGIGNFSSGLSVNLHDKHVRKLHLICRRAFERHDSQLWQFRCGRTGGFLKFQPFVFHLQSCVEFFLPQFLFIIFLHGTKPGCQLPALEFFFNLLLSVFRVFDSHVLSAIKPANLILHPLSIT